MQLARHKTYRPDNRQECQNLHIDSNACCCQHDPRGLQVHVNDDHVAAAADQVKQQGQTIVTGTQASMQRILSEVFGPRTDPFIIPIDEMEVIGSNVFRYASQGQWLDNVASREDLAKQMQTNLEN